MPTGAGRRPGDGGRRSVAAVTVIKRRRQSAALQRCRSILRPVCCLQMKKPLVVVISLLLALSALAVDIPASITGRIVTEQTWESFMGNLRREVAAWRTPTDTPELIESLWNPLHQLECQYIIVDGLWLRELSICKTEWFNACRGRTVAELVAIGAKKQTTSVSAKDAAQIYLCARWESGCRKYLAIILIEDEEIARTPGLVPEQTTTMTMDDLEVIKNDRHSNFVVYSDKESEAREADLQTKSRAALWAFMEAYNKALYEKLSHVNPPAPAAALPSF